MFVRGTSAIWRDINADKFVEFKVMVGHNHTALGGTLCKLGVRPEEWSDKFSPIHNTGSNWPADFFIAEMHQGV